MTNKVYLDDNMIVLSGIPSDTVNFIYLDPPFNTGKKQSRTRIKVARSNKNASDRVGFGDKPYKTTEVGTYEFADDYDNYFEFINPRLQELYRVLSPVGSMYFHIDYREAHYCKVNLDRIFGRNCFLNELIWAYDYGAKSTKKWPTKHDTILVYVKNPKEYTFNQDAIDRIPYMAPAMVGDEKAGRMKRQTDVLWQTIIGTNSQERKDGLNYPTAKPMNLIRQFVLASSNPGDMCLDPFAGSGVLGAVCLELNRQFMLIDNSKVALKAMQHRFKGQDVEFYINRKITR